MTDDQVRNITSALASIGDHWAPRRLTSINDYDVKLAKFLGEFVWHSHPDTDELFLVLEGTLTIQLRDGDVVLGVLTSTVVDSVDGSLAADAEMGSV